MAGLSGLRKATSHAILSANYIAHSLKHKFKILYKGKNNFVAHECILDFRDLKSLVIASNTPKNLMLEYFNKKI